MVVRYNFLPEQQYPNVNVMGYLAQGEASQLNSLRQRVLENQLAEQENLKGVITQPGFDLSSPEAIKQLTGAGALDEAIKLRTSQDESRVRRAMEQNYLNEVLIRGKKFDAELPSIREIARKNAFDASSAELKNMTDATGVVQDILSRTSEESWQNDASLLRKLDPNIMVPDKFTPKWNERMMRTAKLWQEVATDTAKEKAKSEIPKVVGPKGDMPGYAISPRGVAKIPERSLEELTAPPPEEQPNLGQTAWGAEPPAPVVRRPPAMQGRLISDFALSPEAQDVQDRLTEEKRIAEAAPIGKEKQAVGAYRFTKTLQAIGNTYIDLAKAKGLAVPGESPAETFQALANRTRAGEILGKLDASERSAILDQLRSQITSAIPQMAASAGLQSKNFDSDAEGKRLLAAMGGPDQIANISSGFRILNDLNTQFGSGKPLFEAKKEEEKILQSRRGVAGESAAVSAPPSAIEYLRANPNLADAFDKKYGAGSAAKVLGR